MSGLVQLGSQPARASGACAPVRRSNTVLWLQLVTLSWTLIECGASLWAAAAAHSTAMLAFGSDSLVELELYSSVAMALMEHIRLFLLHLVHALTFRGE